MSSKARGLPRRVHVWLSVERLGTLRLHTPGDGSLEIAAGEPYEPYDMQESGSVALGEGPEALVERVGQRIEDVSRLQQAPPGMQVGLVLHFQDGSVGVANLGDELVIGRWPAYMWTQNDVVEEHRAFVPLPRTTSAAGTIARPALLDTLSCR